MLVHLSLGHVSVLVLIVLGAVKCAGPFYEDERMDRGELFRTRLWCGLFMG